LADYPLCTLPFGAPESYSKKLRYDTIKADVYSFGSCLSFFSCFSDITCFVSCFWLLLDAFPHWPIFAMPKSTSLDYQQRMQRWTHFFICLKKDINCTKLLCQSFSITLRNLLVNWLEPLPTQRINLDQFIWSDWITQNIWRQL
jgi:serine/threonine protein kinase